MFLHLYIPISCTQGILTPNLCPGYDLIICKSSIKGIRLLFLFLLHLLLGLGGLEGITLEVELHKQDGVASVHKHRGPVRFWTGETLISLRVHDTEGGKGYEDTDPHLRNLQKGNDLRIEPLRFGFDRHQVVVKVHDGMDTVVHLAEEERCRRLRYEGIPRAKGCGNVMVPMQKDEFLLVNDNKVRIDVLRDFAQRKEHAPNSCRGWTDQRFRIVTELSPDAVVVQVVHQLTGETEPTNKGKDTQKNVPCRQTRPPFQRRTTLHRLRQKPNHQEISHVSPYNEHRIRQHPFVNGNERKGILPCHVRVFQSVGVETREFFIGLSIGSVVETSSTAIYWGPGHVGHCPKA